MALFVLSTCGDIALKWAVVDKAAGPQCTARQLPQAVPVVIALFTIRLEGSEKGPVLLMNVLEEIVKMANLLYLNPALHA